MKQNTIIGTVIALIFATGMFFVVQEIKDITITVEAPEVIVGSASFAPPRNTASSFEIITVTVDQQLLATSSGRYRARVVNNCGVTVYLTDSGDTTANLTSGAFFLAANGGVWDTDNNQSFVVTSAIRATSTDETACALSVTEWR